MEHTEDLSAKEKELEMPGWWQKFERRADTWPARFTYAFSAFIDSWFVFIPPEILLAGVVLLKPRRWIFYTLYTVFFSVVGALFGYMIGAFFFDSIGGFIITTLGAENFIDQARQLYNDNAFWTLVLTGITPLPFVPFVLAAGSFNVNLVVFVLAVIIARLLRYGPIALVIRLFGKRGLKAILWIDRVFGTVGKVLLALAAVAAVVILVHVLF